MAKQLITLLVGPPGSGKEQWIETVSKGAGNVTMLSNVSGLDDAIASGQTILVDAPCIKAKSRESFLEKANKKGLASEIIVFHASMDECLRNGGNIREMKSFFTGYERVADGEADTIERLGWTEGDVKCVISDLDGTLANIDHRMHFIESNDKPDWDGFFNEMTMDGVNEWCSQILSHMSATYPIVYVTGRPSDYLEHTQLWLSTHGMMYPGCKIFTRRKNDFRSDRIIKEIILDFEIKTRYEVLFVMEDSFNICRMFRKHGLRALQCQDREF